MNRYAALRPVSAIPFCGFSGCEGQNVGIIPSRNAVIVRMGRKIGGRKAWDQDEFMGHVLKALPKE